MKELQEQQTHLYPFLAARSFEGRFVLGGTQYDVAVSTPDLWSCPISAWGDWGPMYTVGLDHNQKVRVTYRCEDLGLQAEYLFSPPTIGLLSPMRADDRARWPLYLEIADVGRGLRFDAYLDEHGRFDHLEVARLHARVDVAPLIFRTPSSVLIQRLPSAREMQRSA